MGMAGMPDMSAMMRQAMAMRGDEAASAVWPGFPVCSNHPKKMA